MQPISSFASLLLHQISCGGNSKKMVKSVSAQVGYKVFVRYVANSRERADSFANATFIIPQSESEASRNKSSILSAI